MSKYTFRIPTGHQYAFVEVVHEPEEDYTAAQVSGIYDEYTKAMRFTGGLDKKAWNDCLDAYRNGKGMSVECGERMNDWQRDIIAELGRSDARIKNGHGKTLRDRTTET